MAEPIRLDMPPQYPKEELLSKLQEAPAEHAEAMLALYELLQGLHDQGVLDIARAAVVSKDELIQRGVDAAKTDVGVRGMRNAILLLKLLGEIDPEVLKTLTGAVPAALNPAIISQEPPTLWTLLARFSNKDVRRGLAVFQSMLETFGRNLSNGNRPK